ncbi:MAG: transcription elongation factor GreA [Bacteroidetes bacterium]|nr:transcription elongation factor GreA [Bacteroidota bacterium]
MANKISYYTKKGLENLISELNNLKTAGRAQISRQLEEARSKGDLSENAEYDAAKDAQAMLEMKIAKLEDIIANARILNEKEIDNSKVSILTKVKIRNLKNNKEFLYTLVAEKEADLASGKISVTSPIGKGLLGKKKGDEANIDVPSGKLNFKILDITI